MKRPGPAKEAMVPPPPGPMFDFVRPFGPPLARIELPKEVVDTFNEFVDNTDNIPDAGAKLVGQVEVQPNIPPFIMNKHRKYFIELAREFIKRCQSNEIKADKSKILIKEAWIVRMLDRGEFNPMHIHTNCKISSIGYLKIPENYEEAISKDEHCGRLNFIGGMPLDFASGMLQIYPQVGMYYIFPWYLYHAVCPLGEFPIGERRSFSINFTVKDKK